MKSALSGQILSLILIVDLVACGHKGAGDPEVKTPFRNARLQAEQTSADAKPDVEAPEQIEEIAAPPSPEPTAAVVASDPMVMGKLENQTTIRDRTPAPISFIMDKGGPSGETAVNFTVEVSDPAIIEPAGVSVSCEAIAENSHTCVGTIELSPLPGAYGEAVISIHADNGEQVVSQSFSLFITLNPIANDDLLLGSTNRPMIIDIAANVLANDTAALPNAISVLKINAPTKGGTITNNGNGTVTYLSAKDFIGEEAIDYTITDGYHGTSAGKIKITSDLLVENFTRTDAPAVGNGWTETEAGGSSTSIAAGALKFISDDTAANPLIVTTFPLQAAGKLEWTFDFNWTNGTEVNWSFSMQLGKLGAGSAVNLIWGGGTAGAFTFPAVNTLGTITNAALTARTPINGKTAIKVLVNLDTNTYDLTVGTQTFAAIPFDSDVDIDSITFKADFLSTTKFLTSDIDTIRVKKLP
jgi:hypothetical protein